MIYTQQNSFPAFQSTAYKNFSCKHIGMLLQETLNRLKQTGYKFVNSHTAVKLCTWTKKSIKTGGSEHCYKQKFYGIQSHRCMQFSPAAPYCNLSCMFCWRDVSIRKSEWEGEFEKPEEIVEKSIKAQQQLLSGLGGVLHSEKFLSEALQPKHAALSLDGEPILYPKISELIKEFHKRNMTTFLVTNGTFPDKIESLKHLPTQLYVSLSANSESMFKKINRPLLDGLWQKLNRTLELLPQSKTRRVIRLTLFSENAKQPELYARLIEKAQPDFVEVKAAMAVGFSRIQNRLKYEQMLRHNEVRQFAEKIATALEYQTIDEKPESRVVLLKNSAIDFQALG